MDFTLQTDEPDRKVYTALVSTHRLDEITHEIMTEAQTQIQLPGFRTGKAPLGLIRRKLGKRLADGVKEELEQDVGKALREQAIAYSGRPIITYDNDDLTVDWTITVTVSPPASITKWPELASLAAEIQEIDVTDDDVKTIMLEQQREKADIEEIDEGASQKGDFLTLSFGYYHVDRGSASARTERMDSSEFDKLKTSGVPWMEMIATQVIGMEPGDSLDLDVDSIPEEWGDEAMAGKSGKFMVDVVKVERPILEELSDDVAQDLDFDDLEDWKTKTRQALERDAEQVNESREFNAIYEAIAKEAEFIIPDTVMDEEMMGLAMRDHEGHDHGDEEHHMQHIRDSYLFYKRMYEVEQQQAASSGKLNDSESRRLHKLLQTSVQRRLVSQRLSEELGGEPSIDELQAEYLDNVSRQMRRSGQKLDDDMKESLLDDFMDNEKLMDMVRDTLRTQKAFKTAREAFNVSVTKQPLIEARNSQHA